MKLAENKIVAYCKESYSEMKKVVWPTKKETTNYTLMIIAISIIIAAFIGVVDYVLTIGVQQVIK